jgi:hypothetical protein
MDKERILITVKTYPTLSRKYGETVCTAGVRADGSWVRLYPVPFRRLGEAEQYSKYDWIECRLGRNKSDPRPETFRPLDFEELRPVAQMGTSDKWHARRTLLLKTARVYTRLDELIAGAKANQVSLAVFKPTRVLDFVWEEDDRDWNPDKVRQMRDQTRQHELFEDNAWRNTFKVIPKLPYNFSYRFEDAAGRTSEMQILDWETGALYWNCLRSCEGDERAALDKVREKYFGEFLRKDLHLFLGTTQEWHFVAPNPWVIVGAFPIPHDQQRDLFGA